MNFKGLKIKIENPAGSVRSGVDHDGNEWSVRMSHDYGEIVGTHGVDGDPIDCFLGPDKNAPFVFIVHQLQKGDGGFDEDKCFLGFSDAMEAKAAYYKNFDKPDVFYGSIETIPFKTFKEKVLSNKGDTMIHAKMDVTVGDPVVADGLRGRGVVVSEDGSDVVIRYRNGEYFKRKKYNVHHMGDNYYKSRYSSVKAGGLGSGKRPTGRIINWEKARELARKDPRQRSLFPSLPGKQPVTRKKFDPNDPNYKPWGGIFEKKVDAARLEPVEMEGTPVTVPHGANKRIVKQGTNFCVISDGVDKNFGCYGSREQAEAVLQGQSFIMPDIPDNLYAALNKVKAFGDLGEPMAGSMGHAHIEPEFWFHPPSQKRPDHVPVDDPGEKDNKFLDVDKRKEAHTDRMKRLKRSAPGGLPAYIPAHTTLLAPHQANFAPTIATSAVKLKKRKGNKLLLDILEPRTTSLRVPHQIAYTKGIKARRTKDERTRRAYNAAHI